MGSSLYPLFIMGLYRCFLLYSYLPYPLESAAPSERTSSTNNNILIYCFSKIYTLALQHLLLGSINGIISPPVLTPFPPLICVLSVLHYLDYFKPVHFSSLNNAIILYTISILEFWIGVKTSANILQISTSSYGNL